MSVKFDLILDLRSGSVGACAYAYEKRAKVPTCLFATRIQIPLQREFDSERGLGNLAAGIKLALDVTRKHVPGHPRSLSVIIGTPWYLSQTRTVIYKGEGPMNVDGKLVGRLLDTEIDSFTKEHYPNRPVEIIERVVMKTTLNGYRTNSPYGKRARELEIIFYLSMMDKVLLEMVRKEVAFVYHRSEISLHTFTFAAWQASRLSLIRDIPNLTFVDIGGEVSEWTLIEENSITESVSFPLGAHTITRDIAKGFNIDLEEARSLYAAYLEKRTSAAVDKKIVGILSGVGIKWATYVSGILQKLSNTRILPSQYCVVGMPETTRLFCETLDSPLIKSLDLTRNTNSCFLPKVEELKQFFVETVYGKPDVFLALEMLFVDKYVSML